MILVKQHVPASVDAWRARVDELNTLLRVRTKFEEAFERRRRHGHHIDNSDKLSSQAEAIARALRPTCFVLTVRELEKGRRTARHLGGRVADVRGEAMRAIMPWLLQRVAKLRHGTDVELDDLVPEDEEERDADDDAAPTPESDDGGRLGTLLFKYT